MPISLIAGLVFSTAVLGILFKVQLWPLSAFYLFLSMLGLAMVVVLVLVIRPTRPDLADYWRGMLFRGLPLLPACMAFFFLPSAKLASYYHLDRPAPDTPAAAPDPWAVTPIAPNDAVIKAYERHHQVRLPGSADSLFAKAEWVLGDTAWWSFKGPVDVSRTARTIRGRCVHTLKYSTGKDEHSLNGAMELTYDLAVTVSDEHYAFDVRNTLLDGRPPLDADCWVPCDPPPYEGGPEAQYARLRQASKWQQLHASATGLIDNVPSRFLQQLSTKEYLRRTGETP